MGRWSANKKHHLSLPRLISTWHWRNEPKSSIEINKISDSGSTGAFWLHWCFLSSHLRLVPSFGLASCKPRLLFSTMEAEYIALSTACLDLFPLIDKLTELTSVLNLPFTPGSNMHVRIHEDNVGALILGKLKPHCMTPRSKHYPVKYHWFREHLGPQNIELVKIASANQLGDIFTKGLTATTFANMQKQLMGWWLSIINFREGV